MLKKRPVRKKKARQVGGKLTAKKIVKGVSKGIKILKKSKVLSDVSGLAGLAGVPGASEFSVGARSIGFGHRGGALNTYRLSRPKQMKYNIII